MNIFTKLITKTSVHLLIPISFFLAILFLAMQTYFIAMPHMIKERELEFKQELTNVISHSQVTINSHLKTKVDAIILEELQFLHNSNLKIEFAGIFDKNYELVYSSEGNYSQEFTKEKQLLMKDFKESETYIYANELAYHLYGITKVDLSFNDSKLSKNKYGYLFVKYDYTEDIENLLLSINRIFLISLGMAIIIALLLGFLVYVFFARKTELLNTVATELQQGRYGRQLEVKGFKEITTLVDSFNKMSMKLATDMELIKQNEQELRYEKEIAQNYLDIAGVMILVLDQNYNVKLINKRGCEIIGYELEEVIGKNWVQNFLPERFRKKVSSVGESLTDEQKTAITRFENPVLCKSGEERLISWNNRPLLDANGEVTGIITSGEDISDIEKAKLELQSSEAFYRSIFTSVKESIIILRNNVIVDCNEGALALFEIKKENLIGINIIDEVELIKCIENDLNECIDKALDGNSVVSQCRISANNLKKSKISDITFSRFGNDNNEVICTARDITQKLQQERLLKTHTRKAQMGEMISMIAHQWRQPLASIAAMTSSMMFKEIMDKNEDSDRFTNLKKIEKQIMYLSQTISDFRDFFLPDKLKENVLLSQIVKNSIELLDHTIKSRDIEIIQTVVKDSLLDTFKSELTQVLMTMIKNSIDAFAENEISNSKLEFLLDQTPTHAQLQVIDNAGGISSEIIDDIFLPYFSSKGTVNGTGLGLYMCKTIVEDNCKGKLEVQSEGKTTIFTILLPLNEDGE